MSTPHHPRAYGRSERVTFQVQTRAEGDPFRNLGSPCDNWITAHRSAQAFVNSQEGVRILAYLDGHFYAIVWEDGQPVYEGTYELSPEVAAAMSVRDDDEHRKAELQARARDAMSGRTPHRVAALVLAGLLDNADRNWPLSKDPALMAVIRWITSQAVDPFSIEG